LIAVCIFLLLEYLRKKKTFS